MRGAPRWMSYTKGEGGVGGAGGGFRKIVGRWLGMRERSGWLELTITTQPAGGWFTLPDFPSDLHPHHQPAAPSHGETDWRSRRSNAALLCACIRCHARCLVQRKHGPGSWTASIRQRKRKRNQPKRNPMSLGAQDAGTQSGLHSMNEHDPF